MAKEIERKFLVNGTEWKTLGTPTVYCQGYLNSSPQRTVRVRIAGDHAYLTIKGPNKGAARSEFEYPIPVEDARAMLEELAEKPIIEKTRTVIFWQGNIWEVDEFAGVNAGLVVAEIELTDEAQAFVKPSWAGKEVTGDARYYNSSLVAPPYSSWKKST